MSDIATSLISDDEREYLILQNRAISAADDGTYEWALNEIDRLREGIRKLETVHRQRNEWGDRMMAENERLREALRQYECKCEGYCQGISGEVCGHPARNALGEGK